MKKTNLVHRVEEKIQKHMIQQLDLLPPGIEDAIDDHLWSRIHSSIYNGVLPYISKPFVLSSVVRKEMRVIRTRITDAFDQVRDRLEDA